MIRKKFQRDGLRKFQIVGAINFTHPAFAEQAHDTIAINQDRSRYKPRVVDGIERGERSFVAGCTRQWRVELLGRVVVREAAGRTSGIAWRNSLMTTRAIHRGRIVSLHRERENPGPHWVVA